MIITVFLILVSIVVGCSFVQVMCNMLENERKVIELMDDIEGDVNRAVAEIDRCAALNKELTDAIVDSKELIRKAEQNRGNNE